MWGDRPFIELRLKRGTEQVTERRNEGMEQLQIVEEPVMNGTSGTELMNNLSVGLKRGTDISSEVSGMVV